MDEEDTITGGASPDFLNQLTVMMGEQASAQERARQVRQQQLQQATEMLKQRRYGPSTAEQLFALSAAFATPTRQKGLGPVLANVMPVLAQTAAARRQGQMEKEDTLLSLQNKYAVQDADAEVDAVKNRINSFKVAAQMGKPARPFQTADALGRGVLVRDENGVRLERIQNEDGGAPRVTAGSENGVPTKTVNGTKYYFYDGDWDDTPPASAKGGPTGSPPSGSFR